MSLISDILNSCPNCGSTPITFFDTSPDLTGTNLHMFALISCPCCHTQKRREIEKKSFNIDDVGNLISAVVQDWNCM